MRFDTICEANGIEHRLTKPNRPWSSEDRKPIRGIVFPRDGQVERMNRTIRDATVKRYHYDSNDRLRSHLADFLGSLQLCPQWPAPLGVRVYKLALFRVWSSLDRW
jgi:hypothetical protein